MDRRSFITGIAISGLSLPTLLASCGLRRSVSPGTSVPPATMPVPSTIAVPTGADEFVVRVRYSGGLVANNYDIMRTPSVLITADGRAITPGAVPAIYPGPLLPAFRERTITADGIQAVVVAAQQAQLLGPIPNYEVNPFVADAADTVVEIHAMGKVFTHVAYALDMPVPAGTVESEARKRLRTFVQSLTDIATFVGADQVGPDGPLHASAYRVQANPANPADYGEPKPTVSPWPAGTGVVLAEATPCVEASAAQVGAVLEAANQLSMYTEAGATYILLAAPVLPGDNACPPKGSQPGATTSVPSSLGG
jgi:hypothetical protein